MNIQKFYRPISEQEISSLKNAKQIFSDCYLVSTLNALTRTDTGKSILKKHIQKTFNPDLPEYKIHFSNIYDSEKDIFVTLKEINNLKLSDKYGNIVMHNIEENNTLKAMEIAMNKLIKQHPFLKSLISRIPKSVEKFEYNSPSKFMHMFTGKKPRCVNEYSLKNTLISSTPEAKTILNLISSSNGEHNFIAGTGYFVNFPKLETWHCYVITDVNKQTEKINIYNQKTGESFDLSINTFLKKFKFITGFLSKDLNR